jgi:hypothetical protein
MMSELVTVYHGTRSTAESVSGKRFRTRDAVAEAKRIADIYDVADIDLVMSDQFAELDRNLTEAEGILSVTGHFETAARYAKDGSNAIELLLHAVLDLTESGADEEHREYFRAKHLERHEGEAVVLEFRLPVSQLTALPPYGQPVTAEDVARPYSEFTLSEKAAVSSLTQRYRLDWVPY